MKEGHRNGPYLIVVRPQVKPYGMDLVAESGVFGTIGVDDWPAGTTLSGNVLSSGSGSGSFTITGPNPALDFTTEGTETLQVKIAHHATYNFASYYIAQSNINVNDTSQDPTATITPSTNFNINEGSSQTFTVTMTNYSSGSVPYQIILSPEAEESDINVPVARKYQHFIQHRKY